MSATDTESDDAFKALSHKAERKKKEGSIERSFVDWCKKEGIVQKKLQDGRGFPDRTVFLGSGVCIFIELKKPGGRTRPNQKAVHEELIEAGYKVLVSSDLKEVQAWVLAMREKFGFHTSTKVQRKSSSTPTP